jgi:hypothetical protein
MHGISGPIRPAAAAAAQVLILFNLLAMST